jgi:hypothetical protein
VTTIAEFSPGVFEPELKKVPWGFEDSDDGEVRSFDDLV